MRNDIRPGSPPIEADRCFHVTIAELTGNTPVLLWRLRTAELPVFAMLNLGSGLEPTTDD